LLVSHAERQIMPKQSVQKPIDADLRIADLA
jgi:hypothetical protein